MNSPAIDLAVDGEQLASVNAGDNLIVYLILLTSLVALGFAALFAREVLAAGQGTPKMIEIATAIQVGAAAYLRRQFKTIAVIMIPVAAIVFLTSTEVLKPDDTVALSFLQSGTARTLAFVRTFCGSDLPAAVKEAALYNLSTLRSQTTFRTPDGVVRFPGLRPRSRCRTPRGRRRR